MKHIKEGMQHAAVMTMKIRARGGKPHNPNQPFLELQTQLLAAAREGVSAQVTASTSLRKLQRVVERSVEAQMLNVAFEGGK